MTHPARVEYQSDPSQYKHWKLTFDGPVATLKADFDENAGLRPGYKLKLNSYDLGVDIELNDAVSRIRFEHPEVRTVVMTSAKEKVFCSGANIFMLGVSSHAWKVNFCKFTNETRNGLEDSSAHSGLKFLAAVNGACAGGGAVRAAAGRRKSGRGCGSRAPARCPSCGGSRSRTAARPPRWSRCCAAEGSPAPGSEGAPETPPP